MLHKLKILPNHFESVIRGDKKFEIRDNTDRGFQKGDTVVLEEFDPQKSLTNIERCYTGKQTMVNISYVSNFNQKDNYVVFGFSLIANEGFQQS